MTLTVYHHDQIIDVKLHVIGKDVVGKELHYRTKFCKINILAEL